jgi:hypothetical protein
VLNVYDRIDRLDRGIGAEGMGNVVAGWPAAGRREGSDGSRERVWRSYLAQVRAVVNGYYPEIDPSPSLASASGMPVRLSAAGAQ